MSGARRSCRPCVIAAAAAVATSVVAGPLVSAADASTTPSLSHFDARLLHDVNNARSNHGLRKLTLVAGTTDIAHHWSCHLASALTLAHDLDLASKLDTHGSALWTTYGENVGMGSTSYGADRLFHSYMHDPSHRANILDPGFRYVGIWSKRHDGRRWNTIDFVGSPVSSYNTSYGSTKATC
jgi:uncharacterized protein YkwD